MFTVLPESPLLLKPNGFGYESYACYLAWNDPCDGPPDAPHRRRALESVCLGCLYYHPEWYHGRHVSWEDTFCEHGWGRWSISYQP
jgi:hypothetical protein